MAKKHAEAPSPVYGTPDEDTPELTPARAEKLRPAGEFFAAHGRRPPGRPKSERPKVAVHIRLDADIVEHFKRDGDGWQTRLNSRLRDLIKG